jgi:hypothetical protein
MAKKKQPQKLMVSTQTGQLSSPGGELYNYLIRTPLVIGNPQNINASAWRAFVAGQEVAVLCRDAITSHLISLDWKIVAEDVNKQDELKEEIKHYTKLFERGNAYYYDLDFTSQIEWFVKDLFDLPFGTASEFGREFDEPAGKVVWIRPLDAGTLMPTLNGDWPIMQQYQTYPPVFFPRDSVSRAYLSPRTEIRREGWGLAPPERIYLAMEMLNMGDKYYAQLLMNTPEAGILDLMDMDATSATEWVKSFRDLLYGVNPLKIPVLYEHTSEAKWIPFGKLPSEILYDSVTNKYITIVTAGYGLSPSDIGFASSSNGGETLSGTIRAERRSARSGKAVAEKKFQSYANTILPETLRWKWINQDDEKNVAMARARMADANASTQYITNKVFTPAEIRRQAMADGLYSISMPENPPPESSSEWPTPPAPTGAFGNKLTNKIGDPKAPSSGGHGDAVPQQIVKRNSAVIQTTISKAVYMGNRVMGGIVNTARDGNDLDGWEKDFDAAVLGKSDSPSKPTIDDTAKVIRNILDKASWVDTLSDEVVKAVIGNEEIGLKDSIRGEMIQKAEEEFIQGERDELVLTEDEEQKIVNISLAQNFPQMREQIRRSLLGSITGIIIFISKSAILDHKYSLDTMDNTDNNTLRLARGVSAKVFGMLPKILNEVYTETIKSLRNDVTGE